MTFEKALVVEDDELGREFVTESLSRLGMEVTTAVNGRHATRELRDNDFDLVISDLRMAEMDGLTLLRWIRKHKPQMPVALMTAHGTVEVAVDALREGAADILLKPFGSEQLTLLIERLQRRHALVSENRYLRSQVNPEVETEIVGKSPRVREMLAAIRRVAPTKATVMLRGESGTGKELAARAIHRWSDRADQPFVRVNCAALSETLLESELFGHERGAFTGAVQRREGRFELANKGTLLLDEVSEVSPTIQAKLLRVLEEEEFERVGGSKTLKLDVRIIATSNRPLEDSIRDGSFREDLYYRLHVVPIHLPPLREREGDVPLLIDRYLKTYAKALGRRECSLTSSARQLLTEYSWPGNIRELANLVQRAVVLCPEDTIDVEHLSLPETPVEERANVESLMGRTMEEVERELILRTLRQNHGNRTRSAEILGLTARTICNKIRLYRSQGIAIPEPRRAPPRKQDPQDDFVFDETLAPA